MISTPIIAPAAEAARPHHLLALHHVVQDLLQPLAPPHAATVLKLLTTGWGLSPPRSKADTTASVVRLVHRVSEGRGPQRLTGRWVITGMLFSGQLCFGSSLFSFAIWLSFGYLLLLFEKVDATQIYYTPGFSTSHWLGCQKLD